MIQFRGTINVWSHLTYRYNDVIGTADLLADTTWYPDCVLVYFWCVQNLYMSVAFRIAEKVIHPWRRLFLSMSRESIIWHTFIENCCKRNLFGFMFCTRHVQVKYISLWPDWLHWNNNACCSPLKVKHCRNLAEIFMVSFRRNNIHDVTDRILIW